ncbi:MAG TPA: DoxX family protein [Burkholderiales bacterium]|nr:DoxX family protein [Burkholderiales bacterium]
MEIVRMYGPLVGRVLLALIFIIAGFGKLTGFEGTVGYIQSVGLPAPQLAAIVAIVVELGGGIMLVIGWKARWAAAALFIFVLVASCVFHPFWAVPAEKIQFMKNLAIMGGMLYILAYGSGPLSVDKR